LIQKLPSVPNQKVDLDSLKLGSKLLKLTVKRLDLIHPAVGGNKLFKLKFNILRAKREGHSKILTFGGSYSNHIAATAFYGAREGIKTIGIIREPYVKNESHTLKTAQESGMIIKMVKPDLYKQKQSSVILKQLSDEFGTFYLIPEGGSNNEGVKGCEEILDEDDKLYTHVILACGTGGTISGIINSANSTQSIIGIPVLNAEHSINDFIINHTKNNDKTNFKLINNYTFGGYAKSNNELNDFVVRFSSITNIPIEKVYTGKLFYGVIDLIRKGYFSSGSNLLVIHTGGLQYIQ